jgi:eukaryotic-like serine/threonine-protein kinase
VVADPEQLIDSVASGPFRVRRLIASGGMAAIYEAEHAVSGQVGALKLLLPHCRQVPIAVERLKREALAGEQIQHPRVVQMLDAGALPSGEPYVFMELLAGESLRQSLARRGRLPIAEAVDIVSQAADGLCAAHEAGVLHRDIKPGNLFLVSGGATSVRLLDFGVSRFTFPASVRLTKEGLAMGTFFYMPPEQMMGAKRVDARADIYSLGVVLYECVVGAPPFVAQSIPALCVRMAQNDYVRVSRLRPDAPPEFDPILERSLRADPDERYASMLEFRDELWRLCRKSRPNRTLVIGASGPPAALAPDAPLVRTHYTPAARAALLVETIVPKTVRKPD